jgi:hypothetical protein
MTNIIPPSYPTQSLRFLNTVKEYAKIDGFSSDNESKSIHGRPANIPLHIIVVGAGLAGLSAAIALSRRGSLYDSVRARGKTWRGKCMAVE